MEFPKKKLIKNGTTLRFSDSNSEIISEETWNTDSKKYVHPYVHCSQVTLYVFEDILQCSNKLFRTLSYSCFGKFQGHLKVNS